MRRECLDAIVQDAREVAYGPAGRLRFEDIAGEPKRGDGVECHRRLKRNAASSA
jgi:hypothetical protein